MKRKQRINKVDRWMEKRERQLSSWQSSKRRRQGRLRLAATVIISLIGLLIFPNLWSWKIVRIAFIFTAGICLMDLLNLAYASAFPLMTSPWLSHSKRWKLFRQGFVDTYLARRTAASTIFHNDNLSYKEREALNLSQYASRLPSNLRQDLNDLLKQGRLTAARQLVRDYERQQDQRRKRVKELQAEAEANSCLKGVSLLLEQDNLPWAEQVVATAGRLIKQAREIGIEEKIRALLRSDEFVTAGILVEQATQKNEREADISRILEILKLAPTYLQRELQPQLENLRQLTFDSREYRMARHQLVKALDTPPGNNLRQAGQRK